MISRKIAGALTYVKPEAYHALNVANRLRTLAAVQAALDVQHAIALTQQREAENIAADPLIHAMQVLA